jgi:regulator of protease activity HflC (stomatin/prohibitin superfamily)
MKKGQTGVFAVVLIIVGFIILIGLGLGFDTVDASHIGVKNRFGVLEGTMQPGMQWTGFFTHVEQYDLRLRKKIIEMNGADSAVDKDGQGIFATIEINYRLNPENVENAYSKIGIDNNLAEILNIDGTIKEGFKSVTSEYTSLEIFQKRSEVKQKAIEKIRENFPVDYFMLENVIITNIDFNPAFKAAIEAKKVAEETAKAREKEVDISKFEANKKIETARGIAESKKLQAEANAYETITLAKAEAEALSLKSKQLTPLMVQNNYIDAWNGQLPQYMLGSNTDILMSMPSNIEGGQE